MKLTSQKKKEKTEKVSIIEAARNYFLDIYKVVILCTFDDHLVFRKSLRWNSVDVFSW